VGGGVGRSGAGACPSASTGLAGKCGAAALIVKMLLELADQMVVLVGPQNDGPPQSLLCKRQRGVHLRHLLLEHVHGVDNTTFALVQLPDEVGERLSDGNRAGDTTNR
jgi:hypothetical protein